VSAVISLSEREVGHSPETRNLIFTSTIQTHLKNVALTITGTHIVPLNCFKLLSPCTSDHVLPEVATFMPKHVGVMPVQLYVYDTVYLFGCSKGKYYALMTKN
jgi:hypothetical protein